MKKILIDARESGTSTGTYIDKLVEYLYELKPGYSFTILTKPKRVDFFKNLSPSFEVVESNIKEFTFREQSVLLKQIRDLKPDLVHFGIVQQPVLYRGKVVTTMHDLTTTRFRNPSKNWLIFTIQQFVYKWVNKRVARKSDAIITPTEYVKDDVAKFARINSRKITVTHESADRLEGRPEPITELQDSRFIMYVGRSTPHKNLVRLIAAFILVKQDHPNLKLVIAGKTDRLKKRLEKRARIMGAKDVVFLDFVPATQLKWLYENCSAYIFPSLSEGFGLPGLEAMLEGVPVISSNATCLPEVYGEGAEYFDPYDVKDIADKISQVLGNKNLSHKLIEAGYAQVKKYSWKRMAEQTISVYESVLNEES